MSDRIDKYVVLVMEYLQMVVTSESFKTAENGNYIASIGLNALNHVFALTYSITHSLESTAKYVSRGSCYFHEYIDQLSRTGMMQNIDCADIVRFVYSKTVGEIYSGTNTAFRDDATDTVREFATISDVVLWYGNSKITHQQRYDIAYTYLLLFLEHLGILSLAESDSGGDRLSILSILSDLQSWDPNMSYEDYTLLLGAMLKCVRKQKTPITKGMVWDKRVYMAVYWNGKTVREIMEAEHYRTVGELFSFSASK